MKSYVLLLISLVTTSLIGQTGNLDGLVADFERGKAMSLAYIDAMPEDQFDFAPAEGSRTFAAQMLHGAQGTIGLVANGTGETRIYGDINLEQESSFQTKSEVKRIVAESFDYAINGIKNMDADKLDEVVVRGPYQVTRMGWIQKAYEHLSHHRGSCAVYLRLQGITPPAYQLF